MLQDTIPNIRIQLEKTEFHDMQILYIHDSAQTTTAISDVLGKGYGEMMQYLQINKLVPMKFMAWYYSSQPPWSIDIAVETNGKPGALTGRIQSRIQPGGEVIIAHMWGPYNQVSEAYKQIGNWLKNNNRKPKGATFEIYLNDPSAVKDPSEIRTDVCQPI